MNVKKLIYLALIFNSGIFLGGCNSNNSNDTYDQCVKIAKQGKFLTPECNELAERDGKIADELYRHQHQALVCYKQRQAGSKAEIDPICSEYHMRE